MPSNNKIIYTINDNSLELYDGIIKKNIDIHKLYDIIKNKDDITELNIEDISKIKKTRVINSFKREDYLDEVLDLCDIKYNHLKDIKGIVDLTDLINYIVPDEIFYEKIRIAYSNKIIDKLLEEYYDYDNVKILSRLKKELINYNNKINNKIIKKLNEYYVRKITV